MIFDGEKTVGDQFQHYEFQESINPRITLRQRCLYRLSLLYPELYLCSISGRKDIELLLDSFLQHFDFSIDSGDILFSQKKIILNFPALFIVAQLFFQPAQCSGSSVENSTCVV